MIVQMAAVYLAYHENCEETIKKYAHYHNIDISDHTKNGDTIMVTANGSDDDMKKFIDHLAFDDGVFASYHEKSF